MHPLEQLMKSVVRIEATAATGGVATGSGFAYRFAVQPDGLHIPAIITNKHVIEGAQSVSLPISIADKQGQPAGTYETSTYGIQNNVIHHPDPEVDLCAILAGPIHEYFRKKDFEPALVHFDKGAIATDSTFADILHHN